MTVYLVGAGPGDPGLLTRRGADLLSRADVVVYDRLVDLSLLSLAPAQAELVDVGKRPSDGAAGGSTSGSQQVEINQLLIARGRAQLLVVRLKGGDPFLFGRGGEEAEALIAAGVPWEMVPGVSSALAAPAYGGVPLTHRGVATSVTVVTGQVGELTSPDSGEWEALGASDATVVILMGMATRGEIAAGLMRGGRSGQCPVAVVEWGTTARQRTVRTTLAALANVDLGSPAVIVVGDVAALDLSWTESAGRGLNGLSVVVTRPRQAAQPLMSALADAGAKVISFPVIETVGPADGGAALQAAAERTRAGDYEWIVFTSAEAVERFLPVLRDARDLAGTQLAVVGPATQEALSRFALVADLVPVVATGQGLVDELVGFDATLAPKRVLFPRADLASATVRDGLLGARWSVDEVEAYRTVTAPVPHEELRHAARQADVVTFASPSAVRAYMALMGELPRLAACIGPSTAEAARQAGIAAVVQSETTSAASLVAGLVAYFLDTGQARNKSAGSELL
jgi:uroporphyrinogen III methyltransferase / synthase